MFRGHTKQWSLRSCWICVIYYTGRALNWACVDLSQSCCVSLHTVNTYYICLTVLYSTTERMPNSNTKQGWLRNLKKKIRVNQSWPAYICKARCSNNLRIGYPYDAYQFILYIHHTHSSVIHTRLIWVHTIPNNYFPLMHYNPLKNNWTNSKVNTWNVGLYAATAICKLPLKISTINMHSTIKIKWTQNKI